MNTGYLMPVSTVPDPVQTAGPSWSARFPEGVARPLSSLLFWQCRPHLCARYTGLARITSSPAPLGINLARHRSPLAALQPQDFSDSMGGHPWLPCSRKIFPLERMLTGFSLPRSRLCCRIANLQRHAAISTSWGPRVLHLGPRPTVPTNLYLSG